VRLHADRHTAPVSASDGPRRLERNELGAAATVLAEAFDEDPVFVHLFPDGATRRRSLTALWQGLSRYGLKYGLVLTTGGVEGVAVWFPPGRMELTFGRMLGSGFVLVRAVRQLPRDARERVLASMRFMDGLERDQMGGREYWYLWALGVLPGSQGRGLGRSLLEPVLERADRGQAPCYLETFNERDIGFYERSGFRVVREDAFPFGLPVWTLIREPGPVDP
jgi:ribosomal protein S18 acetylase RimI-like enzyme